MPPVFVIKDNLAVFVIKDELVAFAIMRANSSSVYSAALFARRYIPGLAHASVYVSLSFSFSLSLSLSLSPSHSCSRNFYALSLSLSLSLSFSHSRNSCALSSSLFTERIVRDASNRRCTTSSRCSPPSGTRRSTGE